MLLFFTGPPTAAQQPASSDSSDLLATDTTDYPTVRLTVAVDPESWQSIRAPEASVTVGGRRVRASARRIPVRQQQVMFVVDTSRAMTDTALRTAQTAVAEFLIRVDPRVEVGLVASGGRRRDVVDPTVDYQEVFDQLAPLSISGAPKLPDGIVAALNALETSDGDGHNVIVLAAGGNNGQGFRNARTLLTGSGVSVTVLVMPGTGPGDVRLPTLVDQINGQLFSPDGAVSQIGILDRIAAQLEDQYRVAFNYDGHGTTEARVRLSAGSETLMVQERIQLPVEPGMDQDSRGTGGTAEGPAPPGPLADVAAEDPAIGDDAGRPWIPAAFAAAAASAVLAAYCLSLTRYGLPPSHAALATALALAAGALVARGGASAPLGLALVAIGVYLHTRSRRFLPLLALTVAVMPPPAALPFSLAIAGKTVYLTDILLPLATLFALRQRSRAPRFDRVAWTYVGLIVIASLLGMVHYAPLQFFIQDLRGPIYLVCGYFIAARLFRSEDIGLIVRLAALVLWYSAGMIVASLLTGQALLGGRVEGVRAFQTTGAVEVDATRFLLDVKGLAFIGLVLGAAALLGRSWPSRRMTLLGLGLPGFVVTFVGLSRQSLLAFGLTLVLLLALTRRFRVAPRRMVAAVSGLTAMAVAIALLGAWPYMSDPNGNALARQVYAFETRVLEGLRYENATESPGNQWRVAEAKYALEETVRNPLLGIGIGSAYRPLLSDHPFGDLDYGARFIHNLHLWYLAKTGVIGYLVFLVFMLWPVLAAARSVDLSGRHRYAVDLALGVAIIGILVVDLFEPDLHRVGTAPLVSAILGYLAIQAQERRSEEPLSERVQPMLEGEHDAALAGVGPGH